MKQAKKVHRISIKEGKKVLSPFPIQYWIASTLEVGLGEKVRQHLLELANRRRKKCWKKDSLTSALGSLHPSINSKSFPSF